MVWVRGRVFKFLQFRYHGKEDPNKATSLLKRKKSLMERKEGKLMMVDGSEW
jgi:hypothetical protein